MTVRKLHALVLAAALAYGLVTAGEAPKNAPAKATFELETIDQPPAEKSAADDLSARSPGMRAATGPYVSIQVNVDALGRNIVGDAANEPSISVNPVNPANMVIGWRQFNSVSSNFRQGGWGYTFDKGAHWTFPGVLTPGTFRSDPVIDVDLSGVFYYQSLKSDFTLDVFKSTNGGTTWGPPVPAYGGDKNWFAIDRTNGPGKGMLYCIWQRFATNFGLNVFTRSVDGGTSFQTPLQVPMWPTFGMLSVGPDGTLYAAGIDGSSTQDFNTFVLARTTNTPNAGIPPTFATVQIILGGAMDLGEGPNPVGLLGQATLSTDHSSGSTRGNVYVLASVVSGTTADLDVNIVRSTDGGQSFSPPVRINDDPGQPPLNGGDSPLAVMTWHWMGAHATAPNGRIDAIWFDTRESGVPNLSRLYYAYSWDAGTTWSPNVPVSPQFNSYLGWPHQNKMGDYSTLVSDATGADVAYAATFNGEQDVYYLRLFPDCNGNGTSDVADLAAHVSLDCNANHVPDECEAAPACIGAGSVPASGPSPLIVSKGAADTVVLSWGASCASADADYAVYEGSVGSFASHASRACSTGGALSYGLQPAAGDAYYLVVPVHADREGSYGTDGAGVERPQGAGACAPQTIRACGG